MAYLMLGIVMIFLSIVFRLAAVFRLTIPLLYALIVPTVFHEWYHSNQQLGDLIGCLLLAAVALSWVVSLVRKIRGILLRRREDKMLELKAIPWKMDTGKSNAKSSTYPPTAQAKDSLYKVPRYLRWLHRSCILQVGKRLTEKPV